jgi:hypothetical protein
MENIENFKCLNKYIREIIQTESDKKDIYICSSLKTEFEELKTLDDKLLINMFNKCISLRQQNTHQNGNLLEKCVCSILQHNNIPFRQQVPINHKGQIVNLKCKDKKCFHVIDFVIGKGISEGVSITNFIVISCKTTCRERWTQDNWTLSIIPRKYLLVTLLNDYPPSSRFQESEVRKIITLKGKSKDDRTYKLTFNQILNELSYIN